MPSYPWITQHPFMCHLAKCMHPSLQLPASKKMSTSAMLSSSLLQLDLFFAPLVLNDTAQSNSSVELTLQIINYFKYENQIQKWQVQSNCNNLWIWGSGWRLGDAFTMNHVKLSTWFSYTFVPQRSWNHK